MYCSNCGNELKDNDKYCGRCGKKILDNKRGIEKSSSPIELLRTRVEGKEKIILRIVSFIIIFFVGVIFIFNQKDNRKEEFITRFEWAEMLAKEFGFDEHTITRGYFDDVAAYNVYYDSVQALAEWNIISDENLFYGENVATGEFIAVTVLKAIGEQKLTLYAEKEGFLSNKDYVEMAVKNKVIKKNQLDKGITKEEAEVVISKAKELSYSLWMDDYENIVYNKGVVQLSEKDVLEFNDLSSTICLSDSVVSKMKDGQVIVFEYKGLKIARKIISIDEQGIAVVSIPEVEEVIDKLEASDISTITFEHFSSYYDLDERDIVYDEEILSALNDAVYTFEEVDTFGGDKKNKGVTFSVLANNKENELFVLLTDENTGISYKLPVKLDKNKYIKKDDTNIETELKASIGVKDISIGSQVIWDDGLEYACMAMEADMKAGLSVNMIQCDIPLGEIPIPLAGGMSVDVEFGLVISNEGEVTLEVESFPLGFHLLYDKEIGMRQIPIEKNYDEPKIEVTNNFILAIKPQAKLEILRIVKVLDLEVEIGASTKAERIEHPGQTCTDIITSFPYITLEASNIVKKNNKKMRGGFEFEIISPEDAPKYINHLEVYLDKSKKTQFVKECTYVEKIPLDNVNSMEEYNEILKKLGMSWTAFGVESKSVLKKDLEKLSEEYEYVQLKEYISENYHKWKKMKDVVAMEMVDFDCDENEEVLVFYCSDSPEENENSILLMDIYEIDKGDITISETKELGRFRCSECYILNLGVINLEGIPQVCVITGEECAFRMSGGGVRYTLFSFDNQKSWSINENEKVSYYEQQNNEKVKLFDPFLEEYSGTSSEKVMKEEFDKLGIEIEGDEHLKGMLDSRQMFRLKNMKYLFRYECDYAPTEDEHVWMVSVCSGNEID